MTVLSMAALPSNPRRIHRHNMPRVRLTASVALYAAALGAAAILVSVIARTGRFDDAAHLPFAPALITAITGVIAVTLITPLAIYHMRTNAEESGGVFVWAVLGVAFGVASSFVTGALIPLNVVFITFVEDNLQFSELFSLVVDGTFQGIRSFFIEGAGAIYTWFIAGALFGVGGWTIDKLNASANPVASKYGPWAFAISVGLIVLVYAAFGPPETLRDFG
jgi:hypothetical protein